MTRGGAEPGLQALAEACAAIRRTQLLLLDPTSQNIDFACAALSVAAARIQSLQNGLATMNQNGHALLAPVQALRNEIARVSMLLEQAAQFRAGLLQRVWEASRAADPTESQPVRTNRRVLVA